MKSFLLCLILIPILVFGGVSALDSPQLETSLISGLVSLDQGELGQLVINELLPRTDMSFLQYNSREALIDAVSNGDIAVGYVLDENFSAQLSALNQDNLIEQIALDGDLYHKYTSELVYTAVYRQMIPYITQEFMDDRGIDSDLGDLSEGTQTYLDGDALFTVELLSAQSLATGEDIPNPLPLTRGILAMGLLLIALMAAATASAQQKGWALFAPHLGRLRCECYAIAPIYALGLLSGAIALILAVQISSYPIVLADELVALVGYQLSLVVVGLALPRLVGRNSIVLLIPFLLLFVLVTHPILLDVTLFVPELKALLQWLPSYVYITG